LANQTGNYVDTRGFFFFLNKVAHAGKDTNKQTIKISERTHEISLEPGGFGPSAGKNDTALICRRGHNSAAE
jgi:hypothetical protein